MADDINKTKKEVEALIKKLTSQADVSYYQNLFDSLNQNQGTIEQFQKLMSNVKDDVDETRGNLNYVSQSFKSIVNELKGAKGPLNSQISSLNKISNIARQALEVRRGENSLSTKQLQSLKLRNQREIDNLISLEKDGDFKGKALKNLQDQIKAAKEVNAAFEEIRSTEDEINKQLGAGPKLLGGLDKAMQKLGLPNLGFGDAMDKTKKLGQEFAATGESMDKFGAKKTFLKEVGSNMSESLSKANLMQAGIGLLVEAFFKLDTMIGDTAKSMGISYQSAASLNSEFVNMANNSGNLFVTTKGINESFNQINAALGTNGRISADILVTQTQLVKQAGYSVQAATMLSKLSLATGKPTKEIAASFLGQAKALNLVNGTAINEKQLLEDISGLSKDTLATFASQPGKLAEAAYEARKLGLDLEKLKGTQSALLDIESSIASEFEAEVLTGKQLNLEKARYFALTNDYASLAKELDKQDITRASFAKMNVIQQEATAKALGMSADTMGGMLMDQEAMSKLSGIDGDNAKEKFDNLVKQVGMEEAKKRLGDETLASQMQSASMQDKFGASIEKLKEVFVSLVDPLMPILDVFSTIFELVGKIMKVINPLLNAFGFLVAAATDLLTVFDFTEGKLGSGASGSRMEAAAVRLHESVTSDETLKQEQSVQDASTTTGGPFRITNKFGATAITAAGDGVAVSPNISRSPLTPAMNPGSRSAGMVSTPPQQPAASIDYDKMAQALSKVQVNTNIDGVQVSNQLFNKPSAGMAVRKI